MDAFDFEALPVRETIPVGSQEAFDAALQIARDDTGPMETRRDAYVTCMSLAEPIQRMVQDNVESLKAMFLEAFPMGMRSATAFYIRMIVYTEALQDNADLRGFEFIRAAASTNEPARESHARSGYMHARACVALLGLHAKLFVPAERPGLTKMVNDYGARLILDIIELATLPRG